MEGDEEELAVAVHPGDVDGEGAVARVHADDLPVGRDGAEGQREGEGCALVLPGTERARCRALRRQSPDVLLVIKGSAERRIVTAGMVADAGADELLEEGYVREVFVAQEQPRRRGSQRRPP